MWVSCCKVANPVFSRFATLFGHMIPRYSPSHAAGQNQEKNSLWAMQTLHCGATLVPRFECHAFPDHSTPFSLLLPNPERSLATKISAMARSRHHAAKATMRTAT